MSRAWLSDPGQVPHRHVRIFTFTYWFYKPISAGDRGGPVPHSSHTNRRAARPFSRHVHSNFMAQYTDAAPWSTHIGNEPNTASGLYMRWASAGSTIDSTDRFL